MQPLQVRERTRPVVQAPLGEDVPPKAAVGMARPMRLENVSQRPVVKAARPAISRPSPQMHQQVEQAEKRLLLERAQSERVQRELREMEETSDLREVDDDVEDLATLAQWHAHEHVHQEKSARWFVTLAASVTVAAAAMVLLGNFMGAMTIAAFGAFTYYIAQRRPAEVRYRILVDGVAINNWLYHFRDLAAFNVVYEPGHAKTIIFRSKRFFSPLLHMEIGEADPVALRDMLLEFLPEDQEMDEPLIDILARRVGF